MTTRPPPPSGRPPVYAAAGRAFRRTSSHRLAVICTTVIANIWSITWVRGAFQDIQGDKQGVESTKLVKFDIVLGSLYTGVIVIEQFGLFAAITRHTSLARVFVGLSLLVVLIVATAELIHTVVHFTFKAAVIDACMTRTPSFGTWGGWSDDFNGPDLVNFCNSAYNRMSYIAIAWLILATLLSIIFASLAYAFYRQLLDPNSFRAPRAPSDQVRLAALHSNQPYGGGYVPYPGFNPAPSYAPPAGGPPPGFGAYAAPPYEGAKLPGYHTESDGVDDDKKDPDAFAPAQHHDVGPSEAGLGGLGYRM